MSDETVSFKDINTVCYIDTTLCRLADTEKQRMMSVPHLLYELESGGDVIRIAMSVEDAHRIVQDTLESLAVIGSPYAIELSHLIEEMMKKRAPDSQGEASE